MTHKSATKATYACFFLKFVKLLGFSTNSEISFVLTSFRARREEDFTEKNFLSIIYSQLFNSSPNFSRRQFIAIIFLLFSLDCFLSCGNFSTSFFIVKLLKRVFRGLAIIYFYCFFIVPEITLRVPGWVFLED